MKVIFWEIILDLVKIISTIYTILVCTKAKKMNPTGNLRNCETLFFPIPSSKECGKLHVPVLGKFYLCVCICAFFCFLDEVSYNDSQILEHLFVKHNKFVTNVLYCFGVYQSTKVPTRSPKHTMVIALPMVNNTIVNLT